MGMRQKVRLSARQKGGGGGPAAALAASLISISRGKIFSHWKESQGRIWPHSSLAVFISVHYTSAMSEASTTAPKESEIKEDETMSNAESWNPELGRIVGGAITGGVVDDYSSPHNRWHLMSHTMRVPDCEEHLKESKAVHDITIRDVKIGLSEKENIIMDLRNVAYLHPCDGVAQFAQVVLADVAGLVLRTWPADADKSVQPTFGNLHCMEGGAFRLRWDREHKTGRRTPGDSKHDLCHALLFFRVWPKFQACSYDVIVDACGIKTVDFDDLHHRYIQDPVFVKNLRSFYQWVPGLIESCKTERDAHTKPRRATLIHFDKFWDMVIDPCIFEGKPSLWDEFTKTAFNGTKAPSKNRPQLKRLLLKTLRGMYPEIIVKTSVDS